MNARILLFPLVAGACQGISMEDPSVKACREQQYQIVITHSDGRVTVDTLTVHADSAHCRKAA